MLEKLWMQRDKLTGRLEVLGLGEVVEDPLPGARPAYLEMYKDRQQGLLQVPSNPKWATFPGFYFPNRYVKSNKNTLCNPCLLYKTMKTRHFPLSVLRGFVPIAYQSARNRKAT